MLHLSSCSQDPPHTDGLQIPPDVYLWESPTGLFPWPEFDPPPVTMNSPAAQPVCYEPQEGWKVGAWWYFTDHKRDGQTWGLPANVFLAENSSGQKMGLPFWKYCTPTAYHGDWEHGRSTVYMRFNARGPRHDDGSPRKLGGTFCQLRPGGHYYEGYDYRQRRVMLIQYAKFVVEKEGDMLVWNELPL